MATKLDAGQKHFLRLTSRGADATGWAPVSAVVVPLYRRTIPGELAELEVAEDGSGRARLTEKGESLLEAMLWL